jgi:hypothetical protein
VTAARREVRSVNSTALFLIVVGALAVLLALRYLDWYDVTDTATDSSGNVRFASLHSSADQLGGAGVATAYFDWLAWTLLLAVVVVGGLANAPWPPADGLRVAGFFLGVLGVVATWYALAQHFNATGSRHSVFYHSTWGVWGALAGFAITAVGAVLGPRTDRTD